MRIVTSIVALCLGLTAGRTFAVEVETFSSKETKDVALVETHSSFPFEFDVEGTYVGNGDVQRGERGNLVIRDFHETQGMVRFVLTPMTKIGILRLGLQTERYSFSFGGNAAIPDNLHSTNLIIGLDTELSDSFLIRIEAQPGFYGTDFDDFGRDTFNVPFLIGGTYIYSSNLQFVFGIGVDALRQTPVLPGGGVRWKFAPQWTLNAVVPTPRLEYEPNSNLLIFAGADVRLTSYRVEKDFGTLRGDPSLNHASISYEELRVGAGLEWKLSTAVKLSFEGGYIPFRNFDFHRTEVRYHQDGGVPYARIGFHAAF
jgi:opacity protein-like surface antigen